MPHHRVGTGRDDRAAVPLPGRLEPAALDLLNRAVGFDDPVESLLGRGDVVSERGEDNHRVVVVFQVHPPAGIEFEFPPLELVAHEKPFDDLVDFLAGQEKEATPPAFEIEKALFFGVNMGVEVVELGPQGVGRVEGVSAVRSAAGRGKAASLILLICLFTCCCNCA